MSDQAEEQYREPPTCDNPDVMTKAYLDNQWAQQAQNYQALGYPLSTAGAFSEAERRKAYLQQCVAILKQALEIRKDESLMAEIRTMLRSEQNGLMVLLDDLG